MARPPMGSDRPPESLDIAAEDAASLGPEKDALPPWG